MSIQVQSVSIRGKQCNLPAVQIGQDAVAVITGTMLKVASIHDEAWLEPKCIPEPAVVIEKLRQAAVRPDVFTFSQRLPDTAPKYPYRMEWDNLAVARFGSHTEWFENSINKSARKHIRKSAKEGVRVEVVPFTDDLVRGICSVYNDTEIRQGRRFWHYSKDFETVKAENASYLERSIFIGAFYENELIGFIKCVFSEKVADLMQIVAKQEYFHKYPMNALLSKTVEICEQKGIGYLTYGEYVAGNKLQSSLMEFKRRNGFEKVDIPRYYLPLTVKGRIYMALNLHKGIRAWIPPSIWSLTVALREKWYDRKEKRSTRPQEGEPGMQKSGNLQQEEP